MSEAHTAAGRLHGGERRPSPQETAAQFRALEEKHAELFGEYRALRKLLSSKERESAEASGITYPHDVQPHATIYYTSPNGTEWVLTLRKARE